MQIELEARGVRLHADVSDPLSLAVPLDFDGPQPNHYGAPRAHARALDDGAQSLDTRAGGSVNCEALTLVPHCNGTHTECVGHITDERIAVSEVLRGGLWLAAVVSVTPCPANATDESTVPPPVRGDRVITARALLAALDALPGRRGLPVAPQAVVLRTLPNDESKLTREYGAQVPAPYLTREAAAALVAADIEHLVTDLPSLDRTRDGGELTAHRLFWGLPPGNRRAADATRSHATVTELAWIAPTIRDGLYLLDLQMPAFLSDAAPSRPVLYRLKRL
jgi:kynurenine formamidase